MTKVLVIGGSGMLGHKMFQILGARSLETYATVRSRLKDSPLNRPALLQNGQVIAGVKVSDFEGVNALLMDLKPDVVVNCVGVIKQRDAAQESVESITINALLPHRLAEMCNQIGARMIHFSTDCVFNGEKGAYKETDPSDATDLYGRAKFLGEVSSPGALTLRSSFIGRELSNSTSLLEWFLAQNGNKIRGFSKALYAGLTTNRMSQLVGDLIVDHPKLSGLYQVSGPWISKYDLLLLLRDAFKLEIKIERDNEMDIDRTLVGDRFASETGFQTASWQEMVTELAADPTPYESWKS